jgi:uncharacterized protein Yka (UPF0111/DUF47 family)
MTDLEKDLFQEMERTIRLLGGKSDILNLFNVLDSGMTQAESVDETLRLVKCWNDSVEKQVDSIPENYVYQSIGTSSCT